MIRARSIIALLPLALAVGCIVGLGHWLGWFADMKW